MDLDSARRALPVGEAAEWAYAQCRRPGQMTEKMREKEKDRARVAKLVAPLKFFSAVVRLCCGSSQIRKSTLILTAHT